MISASGREVATTCQYWPADGSPVTEEGWGEAFGSGATFGAGEGFGASTGGAFGFSTFATTCGVLGFSSLGGGAGALVASFTGCLGDSLGGAFAVSLEFEGSENCGVEPGSFAEGAAFADLPFSDGSGGKSDRSSEVFASG